MAESEFSEIRAFHKRISEEAEHLIKKVSFYFTAYSEEIGILEYHFYKVQGRARNFQPKK